MLAFSVVTKVVLQRNVSVSMPRGFAAPSIHAAKRSSWEPGEDDLLAKCYTKLAFYNTVVLVSFLGKSASALISLLKR